MRGSPFDFTASHRIGERIQADDEQLRIAGGYDHNFVLDSGGSSEPTLAARVVEPKSGRTLDVLTTEPGLQLYTGNGIHHGPSGKRGHAYAPRSAFAIETHDSQTPHGETVGPCSQFRDAARIFAIDVLPVPREPTKR